MSVRTCTVLCSCGPNGEPLRCGYKPGHKGAHSWATLPTFIRPADNLPLEIHWAKQALGGTLAHRGIAVIGMPDWWLAVCASLGDDFPHVGNIRAALSGSTPSKVAACGCSFRPGATATCPHGNTLAALSAGSGGRETTP